MIDETELTRLKAEAYAAWAAERKAYAAWAAAADAAWEADVTRKAARAAGDAADAAWEAAARKAAEAAWEANAAHINAPSGYEENGDAQ
jgi:hypothetical protein